MVLYLSLLILICAVGPSYAAGLELYATGGIGPSIGTQYPDDGTWYQEPFAHRFDRTSVGYRLGGGLRLNEQWALEGAYVNLGTPRVSADFVFDQYYDAVHHQCLAKCRKPNHLEGKNYVRGVDVSLIRRFQYENWTPYLRVGGAMLWHTMDVAAFTPTGDPTGVVMHGTMPSVVGGAGICYTWVCGEVLMYQAIGHSGNPLSTQFVLPQLRVELPVWLF